jgi:hypothetical protein
VSGEPCTRGSPAGKPYRLRGDGSSDRRAAVAADRVFARDALATHLEGLWWPSSPSTISTTSPVNS